MAAASAIKLDHLQVTMRPVSSLHRRPGNPRTHSTEQVRMIAESIREFGWTTPLIIDQAGGILGGHGRLDADDLLHLHEVPCIVLDHLTPAQRRGHLLGIFYYEGVEARERRAALAVEEAMKRARRLNPAAKNGPDDPE